MALVGERLLTAVAFLRVCAFRACADIATGFLTLLFTPGAVRGALGGRRPLLGELEGVPPSIEALASCSDLFRFFVPPSMGGRGVGLSLGLNDNEGGIPPRPAIYGP